VGFGTCKHKPAQAEARATKTTRYDTRPTSSPRPEEWSRPAPTRTAGPDRQRCPVRQTWSKIPFAAFHHCKPDEDAENNSAPNEQHPQKTGGELPVSVAEALLPVCFCSLQKWARRTIDNRKNRTGKSACATRIHPRQRSHELRSVRHGSASPICRAAFASCPRLFPEIPSFRNKRRAFRPWGR
jgi:hypothetical protein